VVSASPAIYRGPCVVYLPGRVTCPFAGVGERAADASNRLAVDAASTEVSVDRGAGHVVIRDELPRAAKSDVVDLVWLATGTDAGGRVVPFTIHLEVTKTGGAYAADLHTHEPAELRRGRGPVTFAYEPLEVVADHGGGRREVLVDRAALARVVEKLPLGRRLARAVTTTRDHLAGVTQDPAAPGYRVVDRSIGVGALGRGLLLVRARLVSLSAANAPLVARGAITEMLRDGAWELSIEALTERVLPELTKRDLFLYHLAGAPLLAGVRERGLRTGQTLGFRYAGGVAELRLDDATAPLPNALDVARAYLEFHMLGHLIAEAIRR
jgi:hypothetical protein